MRNYSPGDEYQLVDKVGKLLGLDGWFVWREDRGTAPTGRETEDASRPQGATDLDSLEQREPAVVMYCLNALERFGDLDASQVQQIALEIALLGQGGFDYTSTDRVYTLKSIPGEEFSGLYLMALMYVAFQRVNPSLDLPLPFADAYRQALALFQRRG